MDILQSHRTPEFFQFIHSIRRSIAEWQIVEIKMTEEGSKLYTVDDIAAKISETYERKRGKLLLCNAREILVLLNLGAKISTTHISKKIKDTLPRRACHIEVNALTDGMTKIQINFGAEEKEPEEATQKRKQRIRNIFIVAEPDAQESLVLSNELQKYGDVVTKFTPKDILKAYLEETPNILFLNTLLEKDNDLDIVHEILSYDPRAHIVLIDDESNTDNVLSSYERGIKSLLLKPLTAENVFDVVQSCPRIAKPLLQNTG